MMPGRALLLVLSGLGLVAAMLVVFAGTHGGLASGANHETEVRVAAQRLADGRMEFALQQREAGGGWGERVLPRARFFPAGATVNRWLASSPLTVSAGARNAAEVRVAARRLADGRTEFALQQRELGSGWGERQLPRARFFPAGTAVNRWLASSPLTVATVPRALLFATLDPDCEPVPDPIAPVHVGDANPAAWTPPPLPGDKVCGLVGGTPWKPAEDLHSGAGARLAEFRARPFLFGTTNAPPSDAAVEDLQSLADAYERWLAAWLPAVRSWSFHPYAALASPAALAERDRLFVRASADWGIVYPRCSPFRRSDAWLGAHIEGDRAVTYSWRRGEAARCTDATSGRDLATGTECVGPLFAIATRWERNPAGDPPWLVVSEVHRDPLAADGAARFGAALVGAEWDRIYNLHRAYGGRINSEESRSDYSACAPRPTPKPSAPTRTTATPAMEREALIALYHALNGPNWTYDTLRVSSYSVRWLTNLRVADWEGVTVTGTAVTGLSRQLRGLAGELPPALGKLTNLRNLILDGNLLTGGIPSEVGNLTNLRDLWLTGQFTGEIPSEIGNLSNLRVLTLQGGFTGEIPSEVGNLTNLTELILRGDFTGAIPREIGNLLNLEHLWLRGGFTGAIPREIGNLFNLTSLTLTGRSGTGEIPSEIGNLFNLTSLTLSGGEIPSEIGNLTNLTSLTLYGTGEIPGEIGNLTNLTELHLQGNFTGEIPREIGNLTNLKVLHTSMTDFTGEIPREIGNLTNLETLRLGGRFTGEIPSEIGNLTNLETLVLFDGFTGAIPREIGNLTSLAELHLAGQFTCRPRALRDMSGGIAGGFRLPECNPPGPVSPADRAALVALYRATDGENWLRNTNWLTEAPVGDWYGVRKDESGRVTGLNLDNNALRGPLPAELGNLTSLTSLNFSNNRLSGPLPAELGNLTSLTSLYLYNNQLSGALPAELGNLASLESLYLHSNQLSGPIPAELGDLRSLGELRLYNNQLSGALPAELGNLTSLESLNLENNQLRGPLPAELGNLTSLTFMDLSRNELSGPLPVELGNLTSLTSMDLSRNELSGPLPAELGNLASLRSLILHSNQLSGCVPITLRDVRNLEVSQLPLCNPPGPVSPADRAALVALYRATDGENWRRNTNWLTEAPVGDWYGVRKDESGRVTGLNLSRNELSGPLPAELGNLTSLEHLNLDNNQLSGPLPAELGNLTSLTSLSLDNNRLSGPLPAELGNLTSLRSLHLGNHWAFGSNKLSGPIPAELGDLTSLEYLDISRNELSGPIPAELGNLTSLKSLDLSLNQLTGPIPAELGNLTSLETLGLGLNQLTGPIPAELGNLSAYGSLRGNQLSGCRPVGVRLSTDLPSC